MSGAWHVRVGTGALPAPAAAWRNQLGLALQPQLAAGERWLLAEDEDGRLRACLRLRERLGLRLPRYSYHVGRAVHAAAELGLFHCQATLLLGNDLTGDSELADLACDPACVEPAALLGALIGAALDLVRREAATFAPRLICELPGPLDAQGHSPFWAGLGRFFCPVDPRQGRERWGEAWPSHLAPLLPRQTVYLSFLAEPAQRALGRLGEAGRAAAAALQAAGFRAGEHVRVDDGGPIWELHLPALGPGQAPP